MFVFKVKCPKCKNVMEIGRGAHMVKKCNKCKDSAIAAKVQSIVEKRNAFLDELTDGIGTALKPLAKKYYGKEKSKYADDFPSDISSIMSHVRGERFAAVVKTATGKDLDLPEPKQRAKKGSEDDD